MIVANLPGLLSLVDLELLVRLRQVVILLLGLPGLSPLLLGLPGARLASR